MKKTGQSQAYYGRSTCASNTHVGETPHYGKYAVYSSTQTSSYKEQTRMGKCVSTRPRRKSTNNGSCHNSHAANIRTRGPHEFHNMMWDPTVYRGNTYTTFQTAEMERCKNKRAHDEFIKRRKFPRHVYKIGGIKQRDTNLQQEKIGLGDMGIQTEQFLEELTSDNTTKEMCTQVEPEMKKYAERNIVFKEYSVGMDFSCQTECALSCPFNQNVKYIQKNLSEKILEQSLLETAEETELEFMRREKRIHLQERQEEGFRMKRLIDSQRIVAGERAAILEQRKQEFHLEQQAESRIAATLFAAGSLSNLLPATFGMMRRTLSGVGSRELQENINEDVTQYLRTKLMASRKVLDVLLFEASVVRGGGNTKELWWQKTAPIFDAEQLTLANDETQELYFSNEDKLNISSNSQDQSSSPMASYQFGYDGLFNG